MSVQMENIKDFHENDVLCGKGHFVNSHDGNRQFHAIVLELKYEYVATPKKQKSLFSKMIVKSIRSMKPPGRFLMIADKSNKLWNDIGDAGPKGAWSKTRQALREGAPAIQKKIEAGEIKVATNFMAEMAPAEIAVVKPKFYKEQAHAKAESARDKVPITAEIANQPELKVIPQSDEIIPVIDFENKDEPFDNIVISDNKTDPTTTSMPNTMLPPEPIIMPNMRRHSLFLTDIDDDFAAEVDFNDSSSEESLQTDYDFQSDSKRPESLNDAKASILPNHTTEAIIHDPTHHQSVKRPTLNSTSLSLSSLFGKSGTSSKDAMASSKNTMTSSKMSLCSMGMASLMQKSIMSSSDLGSFQSMSISADPNNTDISDTKSNQKASVIPSKINITDMFEASLKAERNQTSIPEKTPNNTNFGEYKYTENSETSQSFGQGQHLRGDPNKVSVTASDYSYLTGGGASNDSSGRSIHSEYSSLVGYPFMNNFDTKGESQQSLGHQHNTVSRAARIVPPTESFGEGFDQGTESFPHNSQSFHHGEGFMSTVTNNNGALFAASSITSNGTASIQGQHISMHNGQSLHRGSGFAPILPTPGVNRVSLTSSTVGQGHVAFGNNGQSFQPGQSIVSNINDGDTTPSEVNRVSIVDQDQLNGSSQINGHQEQAKRRQSYCRTGHIAMPAFNEFDGDEDDEVLAEVLDCFAEG
uniref:DUF6824 domain-containing protein n=1 Tax=Chaetoceros debilis TaxID=122233 RepID=A0A7S3VFK7_9STRA